MEFGIWELLIYLECDSNLLWDFGFEGVCHTNLKVGSCPNNDNFVQILFCPFLCSI